MAKAIEQQIAQAEAKLARLRERRRASETRRKIIVGSVVISDALREPATAARLAGFLRRTVTREVDQGAIEGLLAELDAKAAAGGTGGDTSAAGGEIGGPGGGTA